MYNIAIIDDDIEVLKIIKSKIINIFKDNGTDPTVYCYNDPLKFDFKNNFDVLFLDIDMPSLNGIDLAQKYIKYHDDTYIIFITNKYDMVFNSFSVHPFDFIKKENLSLGLVQPIRHLLAKLNSINQIISLRIKNDIINLNCKDILYCESYGHICYIHTINGTIKTSKYKLSNIESIINSCDFYMINQSYLVHWKYVTRIENKDVIFINKDCLPISKRRLKNSLLSYQKYLVRNT